MPAKNRRKRLPNYAAEIQHAVLLRCMEGRTSIAAARAALLRGDAEAAAYHLGQTDRNLAAVQELMRKLKERLYPDE